MGCHIQEHNFTMHFIGHVHFMVVVHSAMWTVANKATVSAHLGQSVNTKDLDI